MQALKRSVDKLTATSIFYGAVVSIFWQGVIVGGWPIWLLTVMTLACLIATFALINAWYAHSQWCRIVEEDRDALGDENEVLHEEVHALFERSIDMEDALRNADSV